MASESLIEGLVEEVIKSSHCCLYVVELDYQSTDDIFVNCPTRYYARIPDTSDGLVECQFTVNGDYALTSCKEL